MSDHITYKATLWDDVVQRMFVVNVIAVDEHMAQCELGQQYKDCYIIKIEEHDE